VTWAAIALAMLGRWDDALREAREALRAAEAVRDDSLVSFAAWTAAWACADHGDSVQALQYADLAVEKAPTPADRFWAEGTRAYCWCQAGDPLRATPILEQWESVVRSLRFVPGYGGHGDGLARAYLSAGRVADALKMARQLLADGEQYGRPILVGIGHFFLGEIGRQTAQSDEGLRQAVHHYEASIEAFRKIGAQNKLALAYAGYGRLHARLKNVAAARDHLTRALEIFERLGTMIEPDRVRQELMELPRTQEARQVGRDATR